MTTQKDAFFEEIKAGFFGDFLVSKTLITQDQLTEALSAQERRKSHLRIGEILCDLGYLAPEDLITSLRDYKVQIRLGELLLSSGDLSFMQLLDALDEQRKTGGHFGEVLVRLNFCSLEKVSEALELQRALSQDELLA